MVRGLGWSQQLCAKRQPSKASDNNSDTHSHMLDATAILWASALKVELTTRGGLALLQNTGDHGLTTPSLTALSANPKMYPAWVAPAFAFPNAASEWHKPVLHCQSEKHLCHNAPQEHQFHSCPNPLKTLQSVGTNDGLAATAVEHRKTRWAH